MTKNLVTQNPVWTPDFTALSYDALQQELIDYIQARYEENGIQDDFLKSNAAVLIIDALSYIANLIAQREDDNVYETWIQTAQLRENVINTARTLGQNPILPKAAILPVQLVFQEMPVVDVILSRLYSITATSLSGEQINFEALYAADDYYTQITLPAGVSEHKIYFYEGTTYQDVFLSTGAPRQQLRLRNYPVVQDSVQVSVTSIPPEIITPVDILAYRISEVETLVTALNEIVYSVDVTENNEVLLNFATEQFGKIPPKNWYIYVDYRIGGGVNGNVPIGIINQSLNITDTAGNNKPVLIANTKSGGVGGADEETLTQMAERIPARVAASNKLSERSDYTAVLKKLLPNDIDNVFVLDYMTARKNNISFVPQNTVYLWILPKNSDILTEDQKQIVKTKLEDLNLIAIEHYLFDPNYVDWTINAKLYVDKTVNQIKIEEQIRRALLLEFGQFDYDGNVTNNLSFNRSITRSKIIQIIQSYIGGTHGSENYVELLEPSGNLDPYAAATPVYGEVLRLINNSIYFEFILLT